MRPGNLFSTRSLGNSCCQAGLENTIYPMAGLHRVPNKKKRPLIRYRLGSRHYSMYFTSIISAPYNNPEEQVSLSMFYKPGNGVSERVSYLHKVIQLQSGKTRI